MLIYSEESLLEGLGKLPRRARATFAAACAERLFHAYEEVVDRLPNDDLLSSRRVLTDVWNWTLDASIAISDVDIEHIIAQILPEDEGETLAHTIADDALASIAYAARYTRTSDPREAVWAARRAYEATDRFVAGRMNASAYTPAMEAVILADDIVQQELSRQQRDLSDLARSGTGFTHLVPMLRQRSQSESALPLADLRA